MSTEKYNDIMDLPHHVSPTRRHMPIRDRAAQFAPFSALTGYDGVIAETARLTDDETELGEYDIARLDLKLRQLKEHENEHPYVEITHFIPDDRKKGGRYEILHSYLHRIDDLGQHLVLADKKIIPFDHIVDISSPYIKEK